MRFLTLFALAVISSAQTPAPAPADVPVEPGLYAVFDTSMGQIVTRLYVSGW